MALIKCPECGHDVSDLAFKCPNCGYPMPPKVLFQQNGPEITRCDLSGDKWDGTKYSQSFIITPSGWWMGDCATWVPISDIDYVAVGRSVWRCLVEEFGDNVYFVDVSYKKNGHSAFPIRIDSVEAFEKALLTCCIGGRFQIEDNVGNITEKLKNGGF